MSPAPIAAAATSPIPTTPPDALRGKHAEAAKQSGTDMTGGREGKVYGETLPNGTRLIIAERPGAPSVKVQVGAGAGSLQDPQGKLGLAHFLEHLAFEGSPTRSAPKQEALRSGLGNLWNAYTDRDSTVYYGVVPAKDAKMGAELLTDMYRNPATTGKRVPQELAAVQNEMIFGDGSIRGELWHINERLVSGDHPLTNNVIGTKASTSAITAKDLRAYHSAYYTGRNTVALVEGDPRKLPLDTIREQLGKLEPGGRVDQGTDKAPFVKGMALQLVPDTSTKMVDINVSVPVSEDSLKQAAVPASLLVNSIGSQLNNTLRRNHHLTYGASAKLVPSEVSAGAVLQFSTSVAPEHARSAMRDLVATLKDAQDGFGPKALKQHKAQLLSRAKIAERPEAPKVSAIAEDAFQKALLTPGIDVSAPKPPSSAETRKELNKLRAVTPEAFARTAKSFLDLANMKILAHGPVGDGADLKAGLRDAKVSTRKLAVNPLDMSIYADMGLGGVPEPAPKKAKRS